MAVIAKSGTPSLASPTPSRENTITGLKAGEAIAAGDVCTIASNGTIMRTAAGGDAIGIAAAATPAGEALTLYVNVNFHYGSGLTPGTALYAGANGALDDAGGEGGVAIARAIDATRIRFTGQA